ncbi:hypothetical protein K490DRAFT_61587 [Saccharata proteae CBS 121410]|uniref:Uncharacterized protein n=1 Tax=Saccharata proteae CBS 121410 TaxID=1314787 RepID=A0A9P4LZ08_9PEZI|nr:hypothetical protein K490DRAFT_61587 [Saccharata proteae CBS 121410]
MPTTEAGPARTTEDGPARLANDARASSLLPETGLSLTDRSSSATQLSTPSSNICDATAPSVNHQVYGTPAAYYHPSALRTRDETMEEMSINRIIHHDYESRSVSPGSSAIGSSNSSACASYHNHEVVKHENTPMPTGVSSEEVSDEPIQREFDCAMDRNCDLGQYKLSESRKVVSDFFGRNKWQTRHVSEHYWLRMCRKHYQRTAYRDNYEFNKLILIGKQLNRILEQKPDLKFSIGLKSSEKIRLDSHYASLSRDGQLFNASDPAVLVEEPNKAPLASLHAILAHCGPKKTPAECVTLLEFIEGMFANGSVKHVPNFELIPEFPGVVSPANKSKNGRLSDKGGIQKTGNGKLGRRVTAGGRISGTGSNP